MCEDAHSRPIVVIGGVSRARHDLLRVDAVEEEQNLGVGELLDAVERVGLEARVEHDLGLEPAPVVVAYRVARRSHDRDRLELDLRHRANLSRAPSAYWPT